MRVLTGGGRNNPPNLLTMASSEVILLDAAKNSNSEYVWQRYSAGEQRMNHLRITCELNHQRTNLTTCKNYLSDLKDVQIILDRLEANG